jgi:hypothetical protein
MEEQLKKIIELLNQIIEKKGILDTTIPFVLGTISSVFGIFLGYILANSQNRKKEISNYHFEYLKVLNKLIFDLNDIIITLTNINKFCKVLIREKVNEYILDLDGSFFEIGEKSRKIKIYFEQNKVEIIRNDDAGQRYYNMVIESIDKILDTSLFNNIVGSFEENAINYLNLIESRFRIKHDEIIKIIADGSHKNLIDFNVNKYKDLIYNVIKDVNEYIKKINKIKYKKMDSHKTKK